VPIRTGLEYIQAINKMNSNIWIAGEKIKGNISEHPAFKGVIASQAKLYDMQSEEKNRELMTYPSPSTGNRVGISFLQPKTKEDLEKRRLMIQAWSKSHHGMLGRSPDYMNTIMMALDASADLFSEQDDKCCERFKSYFEYCRENDIALTHSFTQPQVNRSFFSEVMGNEAAVKIIDKNEEGIVVNGARLVATQGGITDEILILPTYSPEYMGDENPSALAFALPNNTKGMKFICRESFDYGKSAFDHPLGSRFEEMDTMVIFDRVTVPWERVFIHGKTSLANKIFGDSCIFPHTAHQVVVKNIVKTEFLLGIIQLITETIGIEEYQHVQEKVIEVVIALEALKSFLIASEKEAKIDKWGTMAPDLNALHAATCYYPRIYPRIMQIIKDLGASGLISLPSEKDFNSINKDDLDQYLQGAQSEAYDRVQLFRLAWDISMSAFGSRQSLYERFFFGDPVRTASRFYSFYNKQPYVDRVIQFLTQK